MRGKWILALVVGLVIMATAGAVLATPGSGFTAVQQWKGVFGDIDVHLVDMPGYQVKVKTMASPTSTLPVMRLRSTGTAAGIRTRDRV